MSQNLPVDGLEQPENTSQFNQRFLDNYDEDSDEGYFIEGDIQYPGELHEPHSSSPFLSEGIKI